MRVKFSYSVFHGIKVPIIPIEIEGADGWYRIPVFVDSGATFSIMDEAVASVIGIDYKKGKRMEVTVGDGASIPVFRHLLAVRIGLKQFTATIGFSPALKVGFNLLGRKDFFEQFRVCFSDQYQEITFTELR